MVEKFEKGICFTTCICQLTALLCCASILYLVTIMDNYPHRSLNMRFTEDTVMCTTIENVTAQISDRWQGSPTWSSCREGCFSIQSGFYNQILVDVRKNGSNIRLEECDPDAFHTKHFTIDDLETYDYKCVLGECAYLDGIFNCTKAPWSPSREIRGSTCRHFSSEISCNFNTNTTDTPIVCPANGPHFPCQHLDGFCKCNRGKCARLRDPSSCSKRSNDIDTNQKGNMIREGDFIHTAKCTRARDIETGIEVWPRDLRSLNQPDRPPMLLMFCTTLLDVSDKNKTYIFSDCINGTLLEPDHFGNATNLPHVLTSHYESVDRLVDVERRFVPPEVDLLIYTATRLYINQDGCVSTNEQECLNFYEVNGFDGCGSGISPSRIQCHLNLNKSDFVVVRFNSAHAQKGVMAYASIPAVLATASCIMCVLRMMMFRVGDNSREHLRSCDVDPTVVRE